jgi:hypothetical protein
VQVTNLEDIVPRRKEEDDSTARKMNRFMVRETKSERENKVLCSPLESDGVSISVSSVEKLDIFQKRLDCESKDTHRNHDTVLLWRTW